MGEMRVMGSQGDSNIMWDPKNKDQCEAAKLQFDALKEKGYLAFKVKKAGGKGTQIKSFDKKAGKIIMAPPVRGG